jgi:hypothetical protein
VESGKENCPMGYAWSAMFHGNAGFERLTLV